MNGNFGLSFHHLGLALKSDVQATAFLEGIGYQISEKIYDPDQNVHLRFCKSRHGPAIEIVLPGIGDGPLTPLLKRYDELVYHTCYETDNLRSSIDAIEASGLRVLTLSKPNPAILFGSRRVSFFKIMGFGIIEILEKADVA